jgi:anti-anti-sigma factor
MQQPTVTAQNEDGSQVSLVCRGEFDHSTVVQLQGAFAEAMSSDLQALDVDMRGVGFLDSTSLGVLLATALQCESLGIRFALQPSDAVERLLNATGLRDLVHGRVDWQQPSKAELGAPKRPRPSAAPPISGDQIHRV